MFKSPPLRGAAIVTVAGCVLICTAAGATGATGGRKTSGIAYVAVTHQVGSTLFAAGNVTDKVLGKGAITYLIKAGTGAKPGTLNVKATVTVYGSLGSLSGVVKGVETTLSDGSVTVAGTFNLNHGTGGYTGRRFSGTVTGTGTTATGPFVFHDKGVYR